MDFENHIGVHQISTKSEVWFMGYMEKFFHGIMQIRLCYEAVDGNWNSPSALNGSFPYQILRKSLQQFVFRF
jgi:hypothetical protein